MRPLVLAAVLAAFAAPALAQPAHPGPYGPGPMHGGSMQGGPGAANGAADYVHMAGASDRFEIDEAHLALSRAHDPKLKSFARMMIRDHTKSTNMVKAAARRVMGHNPPPAHLTPEQERKLADLRGTHGRDFDRTYVDQQIEAHQQALSLHQNYAQNGDAPPLRHAAEQITPVVQHHLDRIRDIQGHMR